jgi:hypothetical protein
MIAQNRKIPIINFLLFLCAVFASLYCMLNVNCAGYEAIWFLPISVTILIILFNSTIKSTWKMWSFKILYGIEFLRYVVIPVFMVYSGLYHSASYLAPNEDSCRITILLMCYELLVEFIVIYFVSRKISIYGEDQNENNQSEDYSSRKNTTLVIIMLCLIIAVLLICLLRRYQIRLTILSFSIPYTNRVFVLGETIINCCSSIIYFSLAVPMLGKMRSGKVNAFQIIKFVFLSLIWVCINVSDVRMTFFVKAFTVAYIVSNNTDSRTGKSISRLVLVAAAVSVVAFTLLSSEESNAIFFFTGNAKARSQYASTLQAYFGGPYNVAKSIELSSNIEDRSLIKMIQQLYTDIFYNIYPFYSFMSLKSTNTAFNYSLMTYASSHGQIMPIIGQGYYYFGFFFSPIFSSIFVFILGELEKRKQLKMSNQQMSYYLSYSIIYMSFFRMYNITIVFGYLINTVLLGMIILKIAQKFR